MYWLFLSVSLYAINNVLWKIFVKDEIPLQLISRRAIFTTTIAFAALWYAKVDVISFIQNPEVIYVLAGSLFGVAGLVLMVTFLKSGSLVRMGYYSLLGTFIAGTYTYIFRETPFTYKILLGAILILTGYLSFLLDEKHKAKSEPVLWTQHLLLVGMILCFSVSVLIIWECLKIFPPLAIITTQEIVVLLVTSVAYMILKKGISADKPQRVTILNTVIMAIVIFAGIFTGTLGLKTADPFLASITSIGAPILTVFAGSIVFKDKLRLIHLVSLGFMIAGFVVLSWLGNL